MAVTTQRSLRPPAAAPDAERWLEALPSPVLGVDQGERVRFVNAAAADLLAGVGRGLLGRRLDEVFGRDAPLVNLVRRAIDGGAAVAEGDVALVGPGFALGRASAAAAPVGDNGHVALVLTQQARGRTPLAASARTAARTLAHEVRNPLAGIRAAAQLIARGGDEESGALAALICAEVDRIHRLTERMDPFQSLEPANLQHFSIHEVLERVRMLIGSSAPGVIVKERYDPSLPQICGDLDQLIQAFLNIANNAAEAVAGRADGEIAFTTSYRPGVRVRSGPNAAARPQLEVQITDNGPGLDPEVAERVFEPFVTTKPGGMGLGLAVVAEIVSRHEGRVEVSSEPGRTSFRVFLPLENGATP